MKHFIKLQQTPSRKSLKLLQPLLRPKEPLPPKPRARVLEVVEAGKPDRRTVAEAPDHLLPQTGVVEFLSGFLEGIL